MQFHIEISNNYLFKGLLVHNYREHWFKTYEISKKVDGREHKITLNTQPSNKGYVILKS